MKASGQSLTALFLSLAFLGFSLPVDGAPKRKKKKGPPPKNVDAKRVANAIPKLNSQVTREVAEKQMRDLIHFIEITKRGGLSANTSLVRTAMDFRNDIGERQKEISAGAILKTWDTASTYGAIVGNRLTNWATKGRYEGEELVFENIVPSKEIPECKGYIGNIRLVPKSLARKEGEPLDHRDQAYANGLKQVLYEAKTFAQLQKDSKSQITHLAMSKAEVEARWQAEVALTGDAYKEVPNLQLHAQKMGTPSKLNGNRYKLRVEVTNVTQHPTEVKIESTIVGYTDNGNKLYELARDTRILRMRRSQVDDYLIQTPNVAAFAAPLKKFDKGRSQKVIYRGYTIVAKFNGEIINSHGSDARLIKVASGEYPPPARITKASVVGRPTIEKKYDLVRFASAADLAAKRGGEVVSSAPAQTLGVMSDGDRMYQLATDGTLRVFPMASFDAPSEPLGETFAGEGIHSLFSDGINYFVHLKEAAADYAANSVVKFTSIDDLISGEYGSVISEAMQGTAGLMGDSKAFFKLHHGNVNNLLLSSGDLNGLLDNSEIKNMGKLAFEKEHLDCFSDGESYYILLPKAASN